MARKITTEIFIKEMKEIHGNKYDYSKVEYKTCRDKICIICPEHGEFWQLPSNHRAGDGCPLCRREKQKVKFEDFLEQAKEKFGDNPIYLFRNELKKLSDENLISVDEDNIKLTNKGIDLANLVWEEFVN